MRRLLSTLALATLLAATAPATAAAQAWNTDARSVGIGGIGGDQNIFAQAVAQERGDRNIVLPLGLLQLLRDRSVFQFKSPDFDPTRALEYASNPLHLQFGRDRSTANANFVYDLRNAGLQRDLSAYRGFSPSSMRASGLVAPKYGHTFWFGSEATRHGVFAGAGPHLALRTNLVTDDALVQAFQSGGVVAPGQRLSLRNTSTAQLAAAITGGYRGRFARSASASTDPSRSNTAMFVSVNLNYLRGIRYEDVDLGLHLETGADGSLVSTPDPALSFTRLNSSSGNGMSVDLGIGVTIAGFEVGVSGNNLGNRLLWRQVSQIPYALRSAFSGQFQLDRGRESQMTDIRVVAPADYRANVGYRSKALSVQTEYARVSEKTQIGGGLELQLRRVQFRGGASLFDSELKPSAGFSVGMTKAFWIDMAGFTTTSNVEHEQRFAVATSLRWAPR